MPYGSIGSAGLPVTGAGGMLGVGWLLVLGITMTLLGFGVVGLVNLRRRALTTATAEVRDVSRAARRSRLPNR